MILRLLFLLLFVPLNLFAQEQGARYRVALNAEKGLINVHACLTSVTKYLSTGNSRSHHYLTSFKHQGIELPIARRITLPKSDNLCFDYQVDLGLAQRNRHSRSAENSWLVDNQSWLWLPVEDLDITLSFDQAVSVPWLATGPNRYQFNSENAFWPSRMAFGQLAQYQVKTAGTSVRLDIVGDFTLQKQQQLRLWLSHATDAISNIYQRFPVPDAQILVIKSQRGSGPVPWAEVQRGGYPAVHLFVNPQHSLKTFKDDWTASHELSHLLLPKIRGRDRWLSEGLASYYQNIARLNAGQLTPEQNWQKLSAGLKRGYKASAQTPLRAARKTMHIYWGGAAIFTLADQRLRQLPQPQTLAQVLDKLQDCCLPNARIWSAKQLMQKLDVLSASTIFSQLLEREARAGNFPLTEAFIHSPTMPFTPNQAN